MNSLSPGYFATMKIPILEGRDFTEEDIKKDATVAIVNRKLAEHYFPGQTAIGKHLGWGGGPNPKLPFEIIGVVENALYEGPRQGIRRQMYVPNYGNAGASFYVRTTAPASAVFGMIRAAVRQLDATMPVYAMKSVHTRLDET